jgi:serine/threonine protein kinase
MGVKYATGDELVPGFRLRRFLGRGALGEVWEAEGPGGTEAALKIIDLVGGGVHGQKEYRALQLVKRIHHPNLTPIVGLWIKDADGEILEGSTDLDTPSTLADTGNMHQTMIAPAPSAGRRASELVIAMGLGRKSLADRLRECQEAGMQGIPVRELLDYMESAAKALDFLNTPTHLLGSEARAIIHCDVKPLNILIVGGAAQVCDFGLARLAGKAKTTAATMGTVAYIAPETLQHGQPGPATDQYSLAISYYELRTGALPYDDETVAGVMRQILDGELNLSKLPEAEREVIRRATAKDPAGRFSSATAFYEALCDAVRECGPPPRRPRRTSALFAAALAAIALVVAAFLAWPHLVASLDRYRQQAERIPVEPDEPSGKPEEKVAKPEEKAGKPEEKPGKPDAKPPAHVDVEKKKPVEPPPVKPKLPVSPDARRQAKAFLDEGTKLRDEQPKQAVEAFSKGLELDPENVLLWSRRGTSRFRVDDFQGAADDLSEAIRLGGDGVQWDLIYRARVYRVMATNFETQQDPERANQFVQKAQQDLAAAIQKDPKNADAYFLRAETDAKLSQYAPAIEDYTKAIQASGQGSWQWFDIKEAYFWRGHCHLLARHLDEATEDFVLLFDKLGPPSLPPTTLADGLRDLAQGLADKGRHAEALRWIGKAIEFAPPEAQTKLRQQQKAWGAKSGPKA